MISDYKPKFLKQKTQLYKIKEEEKDDKDDNTAIKENEKFQKPKIPLKKIEQKIKKKYFYDKYNIIYYITNKKVCSESGLVKPSLYGYYQINNIMNNKKCRLKLELDEFNYYFNSKEYFIDFFEEKKDNEIFLKFLLNFIYDDNIYNKKLSSDKKKKYRINQFKKFINLIIDNYTIDDKIHNYKNSFLFNILKKIKEISTKTITNESIIKNNSFNDIINYIQNKDLFQFDNNDDIINKMEKYFKYLIVIMNIPIINFNCIFPNYSLFDYKAYFYLKQYLKRD